MDNVYLHKFVHCRCLRIQNHKGIRMILRNFCTWSAFCLDSYGFSWHTRRRLKKVQGNANIGDQMIQIRGSVIALGLDMLLK